MDNKNKCREEINSHTLDTAGRWEGKIWSPVRLNGTPGNPFLLEREGHMFPWQTPGDSELGEFVWASPGCQSQSQDKGTICSSRITQLSSLQTQVPALVLLSLWSTIFQRCLKVFMLYLRFLPFSVHSMLPPDLVTCSSATKASRGGRGLNPGSSISSACVTFGKSCILSEL